MLYDRWDNLYGSVYPNAESASLKKVFAFGVTSCIAM